MSRKRCFLFLQGVCSPFFPCLADRLKAAGHRVLKINFNAGDWAYWGRRSAWNYRGPVVGLEDFLDDRYRKFAITDQLLFGDCRPVHRPAVELGKVRGVRTHVFEEGYFRPYWLTLEREGVNGYSLLPRDPDWYREVGARLPDYGDGQPFHSSFNIRAAHDVAFHLAGFCNPLFFPRYRTHAPVNAAVEYYGYAGRLPLLRFHKSRDNGVVEDLLRDSVSRPFFVLPLQLGGDTQIRAHSRFADMIEVMECVMESFARHAPNTARLVIKNHPLDMGLVNYKKVIRGLSDRFDVTGRVEYMETGDLDTMLCQARGTVTVNSTVGALSVGLNCPTITLSDPIYNLPGLTYQGILDEFWQDEVRPDAELFNHFRNTVIHTTQVNGGLYSRQGIAMAVENCRRVLEQERSPLEELL
jgi:capsular polysaccharide export protein